MKTPENSNQRENNQREINQDTRNERTAGLQDTKGAFEQGKTERGVSNQETRNERRTDYNTPHASGHQGLQNPLGTNERSSNERYAGSGDFSKGEQNQQQPAFHSNWNQVKGKLQQKYGQLTDEDLSYSEGRENELYGRIQNRLGKTEDEVKREINDFL